MLTWLWLQLLIIQNLLLAAEIKTFWEDENALYCKNKKREDRGHGCTDANFTIIQHPLINMDIEEYIVHEGGDLVLSCQTNKPWGSCEMGRDSLWGWRSSLLSLKDPKVYPLLELELQPNLSLMPELFDPPSDLQEHYMQNICEFKTKATTDISGTFKCRFSSFSLEEWSQPVCCVQSEVQFKVKVVPKPKNFLWKDKYFNKALCKIPKMYDQRDFTCEGSSSMSIIKTPNIATGKPLNVKKGEELTIECQSNFQFGYCGLEKITPKRFVLHGMSCSIYKDSRDCSTNYEKLTVNKFNLSLEVKYRQNECIFKGIVTNDWHGQFECQFAPISQVQTYQERCCYKVSLGFEVVVENYALETDTNKTKPTTNSKFGWSHPKFLSENKCGTERFDTRHEMCTHKEDHDIFIKDLVDNTLELKNNTKYRFSASTNYGWSFCNFFYNSTIWEHTVWCQDVKKARCDVDKNFPNAPFNPASKACSFEKKIDDSIQGEWGILFRAANPYPNTSRDCCAEVFRYFNVTVIAYNPPVVKSSSGASTLVNIVLFTATQIFLQ